MKLENSIAMANVNSTNTKECRNSKEGKNLIKGDYG
jgi:hypothetical protein